VETEGPHTNQGNGLTPPEANVVQLGDWIGPRDELIPFGRQPRSRLSQEPLERRPRLWSDPAAPTSEEGESPLAAASTPEPPPSAEDFWGERAAAIHDALQAPSDEPVGAGNEVRSGIGSDTRARLSHSRFGRRSLTAAACLAILALAGLAAALNPLAGGASQHAGAGGSRLPLASVLNGGVSRALTLGLARITPTTARAHLRAAGAARVRRRVSHARPAPETARDTTSARSTIAVTARSPATAYDARETPATSAPTHAINTPSEPAVRPTSSDAGTPSSSATVPATGASGALGPIQSPNG
jgi:hypothetical protein